MEKKKNVEQNWDDEQRGTSKYGEYPRRAEGKNRMVGKYHE